ncbi:MAG: DNA polymerase III subunit gamma/tau [Chloroflexi bacterium]|nr:DNA polymerase III subunit gamma/tau [Chloroflexota bacterium]
MASQVLYRKWRPRTLAEVVGQEHVTRTLLNALRSSRVSHAYLFCGPRGTGKTSTGRILAKAVNCLNSGSDEPCNSCQLCQAVTEGRALDVIEVDAASNRGIDDIRNLQERANYTPSQARYKVYIIDEVHMLTKEASNALLKTLEEPPPHVIFILATTEAHKVLPTILSRCQRFDFRRISQADIASKLASICQTEGIHISPEGLKLIARSATGSLRDAENLLQQMATCYGPEIELHQVQTVLGVTGDWRARELVKHIVDNDVSAGLSTVHSVNNDGLDLRQFNQEMVEYLRALLLLKTGSDEGIDLTAEDIAELKALASRASLPQVIKAVKLFSQLELGPTSYTTLPLELAVVECTLPPAEPVPTGPAKKDAAHQPAKAVSSPVAPSQPKQTLATTETAKDEARQPAKAAPSPAAPSQPKPPARAEPASAPAPPEQAPAPPPQPGKEIEHITSNWKRLIEQAPEDTKRTPALAILRSAGVRPVALDNDTVVLAFRYSYHKEQIEKTENQQVVEKVISHFLEHACHIRCIFTPEDNHLVEAALKMGAKVINVEEK